MSKIRLSGMVSGLDTDTVIKELNKVTRSQVDQLKQQRTVVEWQRDAYREMNAKFLDFRSTKIQSFQREGVVIPKSIGLTGDTSVLTARTTSDAINGTLEITVSQLATAASHRSTESIRLSDEFDPKDSLADQMAAGNIVPIDLEMEGTFSINGKEITIESGDSLEKIFEKINKQTNVTAFYDQMTGNVSLVAKNTGLVQGAEGNGEEIELEGAFFEVLGLYPGEGQTLAQNAMLTINQIETERTSNVFVVQGVEVRLNKLSDETPTPTRIEVRQDVEASVQAIKKFVTDYNDMISHMNTKLSEARNRDFLPLTEEQRKEMSDKEIELWEAKAKSGMLRNDSIVMQAMTEMRQAMIRIVKVDEQTDTSLSLNAIGITTGNYKERGKLIVSNESKLREAIEANPDHVLALFNGKGEADEQQGIMMKLEATMTATLKKFSDRAGTSTVIDTAAFNKEAFFGKRITEIDNRIRSTTRRADEMEDRLYKQFAAMEAAMQRFNSQSAYLAGQLQQK